MAKYRHFTCPTQPARQADQHNIDRMPALARLRLTPKEKKALVAHLHTMLSYVEKLTQVNTAGIEPMAHAVEIDAPLREDRVTNQPNTAALLQNAPARTGDFFVVPCIVE